MAGLARSASKISPSRNEQSTMQGPIRASNSSIYYIDVDSTPVASASESVESQSSTSAVPPKRPLLEEGARVDTAEEGGAFDPLVGVPHLGRLSTDLTDDNEFGRDLGPNGSSSSATSAEPQKRAPMVWIDDPDEEEFINPDFDPEDPLSRIVPQDMIRYGNGVPELPWKYEVGAEGSLPAIAAMTFRGFLRGGEDRQTAWTRLRFSAYDAPNPGIKKSGVLRRDGTYAGGPPPGTAAGQEDREARSPTPTFEEILAEMDPKDRAIVLEEKRYEDKIEAETKRRQAIIDAEKAEADRVAQLHFKSIDQLEPSDSPALESSQPEAEPALFKAVDMAIKKAPLLADSYLAGTIWPVPVERYCGTPYWRDYENWMLDEVSRGRNPKNGKPITITTWDCVLNNVARIVNAASNWEAMASQARTPFPGLPTEGVTTSF